MKLKKLLSPLFLWRTARYHAGLVKQAFRASRQLGRWTIFLSVHHLILQNLIPPLRRGRIWLCGWTIQYPDFKLFLLLYTEIFLGLPYLCRLEKKAPMILDGGSNIGLSVLFFKLLYPEAEIHAFEPDAASFRYLQKNIEGNHLKHVHAHQAALAGRAGTLELHVRQDTAGGDIGASIYSEHRLQYHEEQAIAAQQVPCECLSAYLDRPADLLKLDIEGAEGEVLAEAGGKLANVSRIVMEYHPIPGRNSLPALLSILEQAGHRYSIAEGPGLYGLEQPFTMKIVSARFAGVDRP